MRGASAGRGTGRSAGCVAGPAPGSERDKWGQHSWGHCKSARQPLPSDPERGNDHRTPASALRKPIFPGVLFSGSALFFKHRHNRHPTFGGWRSEESSSVSRRGIRIRSRGQPQVPRPRKSSERRGCTVLSWCFLAGVSGENAGVCEKTLLRRRRPLGTSA